MIIRTDRGLYYNGSRTLKVGDTVSGEVGLTKVRQTVVELDSTVGTYTGLIKAATLVERALPEGVEVDVEGTHGDVTYTDATGDTLQVSFYGDGEPLFFASEEEGVMLTKEQVKHLVKMLLEKR